MKKIVILALAALSLLTGCDNEKNDTAITTSEGNFIAQKETLSSQNDADIRTDLLAINSVVNTSNTKASELNQELVSASKNSDSSAIKVIMGRSKALLESTNNSLFGLKIKSQEVQDIRIGIYQGNMISIKLYELYLKDNQTDKDKEEIELLQRQMVELQQSIGSKLDQLNSQYKVQ
ncbi:hypothetical protein ACWA5Z_03535 [Testudinibacter sp. P80/BLE/0925]|uniref:hypothetical protein n=1 Tax=Testudinibacter sp. TW-1 TaxID=3417757 RepID=UPI003D3630F5